MFAAVGVPQSSLPGGGATPGQKLLYWRSLRERCAAPAPSLAHTGRRLVGLRVPARRFLQRCQHAVAPGARTGGLPSHCCSPDVSSRMHHRAWRVQLALQLLQALQLGAPCLANRGGQRPGRQLLGGTCPWPHLPCPALPLPPSPPCCAQRVRRPADVHVHGLHPCPRLARHAL